MDSTLINAYNELESHFTQVQTLISETQERLKEKISQRTIVSKLFTAYEQELLNEFIVCTNEMNLLLAHILYDHKCNLELHKQMTLDTIKAILEHIPTSDNMPCEKPDNG